MIGSANPAPTVPSVDVYAFVGVYYVSLVALIAVLVYCGWPHSEADDLRTLIGGTRGVAHWVAMGALLALTGFPPSPLFVPKLTLVAKLVGASTAPSVALAAVGVVLIGWVAYARAGLRASRRVFSAVSLFRTPRMTHTWVLGLVALWVVSGLWAAPIAHLWAALLTA